MKWNKNKEGQPPTHLSSSTRVIIKLRKGVFNIGPIKSFRWDFSTQKHDGDIIAWMIWTEKNEQIINFMEI